MGGVLDLGALVVTASMTGEDVLAIDNAHLVGIGEYGERASHVGVGDGISGTSRNPCSGSGIPCYARKNSLLDGAGNLIVSY